MTNPLEAKFDLANNVIREIHQLVKTHNVSYIDAALHYAETAGIEIDIVAEIITKDALVKSKIELEGENLHFIKKTNRLPI